MNDLEREVLDLMTIYGAKRVLETVVFWLKPGNVEEPTQAGRE